MHLSLSGPPPLSYAVSQQMLTPRSRTLRPSGKIGVFLSVGCVVFLLLAARRLSAGHNRIDVGFFALLGLINGVLATGHLLSKIILFPDRIEFNGLFGRRSIRKDTIESVTWAAGCGVSLRTKEQKWVRIPDLGRAQGVCNSIRAWLKREDLDT